MTGERFLVGSIEPGKTEHDPPTFTIVGKHDPVSRMPELRPCEHRRFVLDEKWSTVLCRDCNTPVSPFSALMRYAEWARDLESRRLAAEDAERALYVARLRELREHKVTTSDRRIEIVETLRESYRLMPRRLLDLIEATEQENNKTRRERKKAAGGRPSDHRGS